MCFIVSITILPVIAFEHSNLSQDFSLRGHQRKLKWSNSILVSFQHPWQTVRFLTRYGV